MDGTRAGLERREFLSIPVAIGLAGGLIDAACGGGESPAGSPGSAAPARGVRTLSEQEVMDMILGSSIQAARSSNTDSMLRRAKQFLGEGKQFQIVPHDAVPDDWHIVCAAGAVGGGGAWEHVTERIKRQNLPVVMNMEQATIRAMDLLGSHMGVKWDALIRNEASGGTIGAFASAIARGLPVVDACLCGRCKPEIQIQMPTVMGVGKKPASFVTRWGDQITLDKPADDYRVEDIARTIAVASGGGCAMARTPLTGRELKMGTIPGALTQAILFGKTVREAVATGQDPIGSLVKAAKGFKLFQGTVTRADMTGLRGHTYWDVEMDGTGSYAGHQYKIAVKNENLVAWLNGKPDAMPPDLVCNLDPKTGDAITGAGLGGYKVGSEVAIVGIPAHPMWRTPRGIEIFGPRYFGYEFDYVPIEDLQRNRAQQFAA